MLANPKSHYRAPFSSPLPCCRLFYPYKTSHDNTSCAGSAFDSVDTDPILIGVLFSVVEESLGVGAGSGVAGAGGGNEAGEGGVVSDRVTGTGDGGVANMVSSDSVVEESGV